MHYLYITVITLSCDEEGDNIPLLQAGKKEFDCSAVLLDKDGTLLDFRIMWLEWSKYVINELLSKIGQVKIISNSLEKAMGVDLTGWQVDPEGPLAGGTMTGLRVALEETLAGAGMTPEAAAALVIEVLRRSETEMDWGALARPMPGLEEKLFNLKLKNFKLAVVTADLAERSKITLKALKLDQYFDTIIGADLVKNTKPYPDMALLACGRLGVTPGDAVVIGDSPRDILMAKNAGSGSIGVLSGVSTGDQLAGADVIIPSVVDLQT
ncbi:HAD family hydrolase [Desulfotruncus alcoholivorax]|uniref:HAD family hydrolase n=1 Tax=Desulfotruncus alcoholivorax TaxID=265477 RepID=UPI0003FA44C9|nr:HAD family hydrolase [Desulfotruncus alcoholivorax]